MCRISEIIDMTMALNSEMCYLNCFGCLEMSFDHTCTIYPNVFKYHALARLLSQGLVTQDEYDEVYNYL